MKRKHLTGRILAFMMVFVLTFTMVPVYSFAEEGNAEKAGDELADYGETETDSEGGHEEVSEEKEDQKGEQSEIEGDSEEEEGIREEVSENEESEDGKEVVSEETSEQDELSSEESSEEGSEEEALEAETEEEIVEERNQAVAVEIHIDEDTFPDAAFRDCIIGVCKELGCLKTDGEGSFISKEDSNRVKKLAMEGKGISSLEGIENFGNLETLWVNDNKIESVDISKNKELVTFYCRGNKLTKLDVSQNEKLEFLDVTGNQLTTLDVSRNRELFYLYCSDNKLTSLDVSKNIELNLLECMENDLTSLKTGAITSLIQINCTDNQLTSLDVSKNTGLLSLGCGKNKLTSLNVSNNKVLGGLGCSHNYLKTLDVSKNKALTELKCSENGLTTLNLKNNRLLKILECSDNKLQELDVSNNMELETLICSKNQLPFVDVSANKLTRFDCEDNKYPITVDSKGEFDISKIVGYNKSKASEFQNAKLEGTILTLDDFMTVTEVSYQYNCGTEQDKQAQEFTFQVNYGKFQILLDAKGGKMNGQDFKRVDVESGKLYPSLVTPTTPNSSLSFAGWYTKEDGGKRISTADEVSIKDFTIANGGSGELKLYAHWTKVSFDLDVTFTKSDGVFYYTGSAITPEVKVCAADGGKELELGKDYTLKYSNNTVVNYKQNGAWMKDKKPTITITGKGDYEGSTVINFEIKPYVLTEEDGKEIAPIVLKKNGKTQQASPAVKWKGKTLKKNTDYTLEYGAEDYKNPGDYVITVKGKGNFAGSFTVKETITDNVLMSKVKVANIADFTFIDKNDDNRCDVEPEDLNLNVTYGTRKLELDKDYTAELKNSEKVGTATIILTAKEGSDFAGSITKTFKIKEYYKIVSTDVVLDKNKMEFDPNYTSTNHGEGFPWITVYGGKGSERRVLAPTKEYKITYPETLKKGTMKVTITGLGKYSGTVTKTFTVTAYNAAQNDSKIEIAELPEIPYMKSGATFDASQFNVKYVSGGEEKALVYGTDYTVSYSNNTAVNRKKGAWDNDSKIPKVKFTFKNNYSGTITKEFGIKKSSLSKDSFTLQANDIVFNEAKGKYKTKVVLTDSKGKVLKEGANNDYVLEYYRGELTEPSKDKLLGSNDVLKSYKNGTRDYYVTVRVIATEKGNYEGELLCTYKAGRALLDNAKVTLAPGVKKYYKGKDEEVTLSSDELVVKIGKDTLVEGNDYEIVGYENNTKVGSATVIIKGKGSYYGGSKTLKFTIYKRKVNVLKDLLTGN